MRLTLRTLLAYLDDTLEPAEAKLIGQKVAESEAAQELIARIKEVTRRRRLTTPAPGGPGDRVDPNTIAGYLDNALPADALADVEGLALASDVHLAEIAACHQILTIVLGEPAVVPPTAYRRMYGLVKPPASAPAHQPPRPRESDEALAEGKEVDEALRLGLPVLSGRGNWNNRLVLIGGAACVLILLGVAIWQMLPHGSTPDGDGDRVANVGPMPKKLPLDLNGDKKGQPGAKKEIEPLAKKETEVKDNQADKQKQPEDKEKPPEPKEIKPAEPEKTADAETPTPPVAAEQYLGHFEPPSPPTSTVLMQLLPDKKQPGRKQWTRLLRTKDPAKVLSNLPLLSLPGYHSVVQLDSGVRLTLWGNVPEIWPFPLALESLVTLHPSDQFDLDLTLARGRIAVENTKAQPAKMRLRFANPSNPQKGEVWDITLLEKGSEVLVNLMGFYLPGEQFNPNKDDAQRLGPLAEVGMVAVSGSAELRIDQQPPEKLLPPPVGQVLVWNNRVRTLKGIKSDQLPEWVQPLPPLPKNVDGKPRAAVLAALASLNIDLSGPSLDTGLVNAAVSNDLQKHRLIVRCWGAMDDLLRVIEALVDKDVEVRKTAIGTLRTWCGAGRDNDYVLLQQLQTTYSPEDGQIIMTLLHRWPQEEDASARLRETLVGYLTHKKAAIRELAHNYLLTLYPAGSKIGYNAMAPDYPQRAKDWQKVVQQAK